MKRLLFSISIMAAGLLSLGAASSEAATASTTIAVNATVATSCSVTSSPVNFGTYTGAAVSANGEVSVTCTNGTNYVIALGAGQTGNTSTRFMMNGVDNLLSYSLYAGGLFVSQWGDAGYGDTFTAGIPYSSTGNGSAQAQTVYGQIPSGQSSLQAGSYSDTVNVIVFF